MFDRRNNGTDLGRDEDIAIQPLAKGTPIGVETNPGLKRYYSSGGIVSAPTSGIPTIAAYQ
jgi:hypothetical protein